MKFYKQTQSDSRVGLLVIKRKSTKSMILTYFDITKVKNSPFIHSKLITSSTQSRIDCN